VALAAERIDLRRHHGLHPASGGRRRAAGAAGRRGMADAVAAAHRLGERVWRELRVPVHFYAEAGGGRRLADIRAGRTGPTW